MNIRAFAVAALSLAVIAAVGLAGDPAKAPAAPTPHPHFKDGGTLSWSVKVADAQSAAKNADRLIFIEYGREA